MPEYQKSIASRNERWNSLPRCGFRWTVDLGINDDHGDHYCIGHKNHSKKSDHKCSCGKKRRSQ